MYSAHIIFVDFSPCTEDVCIPRAKICETVAVVILRQYRPTDLPI